MSAPDPERSLAISYAPAAARDGLGALFAFDARLAQILQTTREPMIGQMRFTWWFDATSKLDTSAPPAEPVLRTLADHVVASGMSGADLAKLVEGWEVLLDPATPGEQELLEHARLRGEHLFALAATLSGAAGDPVAEAGQGWALADLAMHRDDAATAERARLLARPLLDRAIRTRWSRAGRALGAMTHLARMDLSLPSGAARPVGAPGRVLRLMAHRLTGR